jgi:hypothetical protein
MQGIKDNVVVITGASSESIESRATPARIATRSVAGVASVLSAHFADELGQGDAGQVLSDGLFGALGHAAHDALHVAAHVALL